jgi:hypothetical protein
LICFSNTVYHLLHCSKNNTAAEKSVSLPHFNTIMRWQYSGCNNVYIHFAGKRKDFNCHRHFLRSGVLLNQASSVLCVYQFRHPVFSRSGTRTRNCLLLYPLSYPPRRKGNRTLDTQTMVGNTYWRNSIQPVTTAALWCL